METEGKDYPVQWIHPRTHRASVTHFKRRGWVSKNSSSITHKYTHKTKAFAKNKQTNKHTTTKKKPQQFV